MAQGAWPVGGGQAPLHMYLVTRNRLLFMSQHARWWHYLTFAPFHVVGYGLLHLLYFSATRRWRSARAMVSGIRDGLAGRFGPPPSWLFGDQAQTSQ